MKERASISEDDIRFYQENGFIQVDNVLSAEEVDQVRAALEEALTGDAKQSFNQVGKNAEYDKVFHQKVNLWRDFPALARWVQDEGLAEIARKLTGSPYVRLWHDHALIKMPGDSKASPWHQDFPYWPMNEPGALSCWLALDDVDERNGCMQFIPGSQNFGTLPPINLVTPEDINQYVPEEKRGNVEPVVCRLKAGSCTFHNGNTFHYAFPNTTDRPRRALVIIYMPAGTTYDGKKHIVSNGADQVIGEELSGERFPILAGKKEQ